MIPQALDILPLSRSEKLMESPHFPQLLELYRCDLCSSFRGPEDYYSACKRYRSWLKQNNNPWIKANRKLLIQRFVAN